jgi:hypothetical protein
MSRPLSSSLERFGLLAEFANARQLVAAAEAVHERGYRAIDAFTPFPIEHLSEIVCDHRRSRVPLICLVGGIVGALAGWALAFWTSTIDHPLNIAGRPFNSWPAFIPVIFETTVLFASFSAGIGMLALNRLPEPYHPVFNVERFAKSASRDGFFLLIEARDPKFHEDETRSLLRELGAKEVYDVAP